MRAALTLLCLAATLLLAPIALAQPPEPEPIEAPAPKSLYDQHMDNGVKLYEEGNYAGALAEFRAAYLAEPKASPLINQALAYKKLADYAAAIEALDTAISKHEGSMRPEHREAAENEIAELKALIAYVTVVVKPRQAKLTIDGKPYESEGKQPVALGPGPHRFRAEAKGHRPAEKRADLTSGRGNANVELVLEPTGGEIQVMTAAADSVIEVDGKPMGRGGWTGRLDQGIHSVRVSHGEEHESVKVLVLEGGRHQVRQIDGGELETDSPPPTDDTPDEPPKVLRGFYFTGTGALLTPFAKVDGFTPDQRERWGGGVGLHAGYRVAEFAGFEVFGQYSDVRVKGEVRGVDTAMQLKTVRVGGLVRILLPGREMARFVGTVGAAAAIERLTWKDRERILTTDGSMADPAFAGTEGEFGVAPLLEIDLGVEVEISNVLLDLVFQNSLQSVKHFDVAGADNPFGETPMLYFGPQLRGGYGIW